MREPARSRAVKARATKVRQLPYDPYASYRGDDSGAWIGPLPVKVVSTLDLTEDVDWSGIRRGMDVLDLGCGVGDVALWIAKVVGPSGLVVGIDESPEAVDVAQRRATVAAQCYWTRFAAADLDTFDPRQRFDVVIVRRALLSRDQRASLLRLSTWLRPGGVIIITGNPARSPSSRH